MLDFIWSCQLTLWRCRSMQPCRCSIYKEYSSALNDSALRHHHTIRQCAKMWILYHLLLEKNFDFPPVNLRFLRFASDAKFTIYRTASFVRCCLKNFWNTAFGKKIRNQIVITMHIARRLWQYHGNPFANATNKPADSSIYVWGESNEWFISYLSF